MRIFQKLRSFQENFISIRYLFSQGKTFFGVKASNFNFDASKIKYAKMESRVVIVNGFVGGGKKYLLLSFAFIGSGRFFTSSSTDHIGNAGLVDFEASQIN